MPGTGEVTDSPDGPAIRTEMADRQVASAYHLDTLHGKTISYDGESAVIVAVWDGRFTAHLASDGREPVGLVTGITQDADGALSYDSAAS